MEKRDGNEWKTQHKGFEPGFPGPKHSVKNGNFGIPTNCISYVYRTRDSFVSSRHIWKVLEMFLAVTTRGEVTLTAGVERPKMPKIAP